MSYPSDIGDLLYRASRNALRLDANQERELILAYRDGDEAAFGHLIIANVRLAVRRAHRLRGYGLALDDLVQEGVVGLLEAATRFDPGREVRFSTYAAPWVKALQLEFVFRNWSIVRTSLSDDQQALFFRLRGLKAKLMRDPAADPAQVHSAIAAALGVSVREVELMDARLSGGDVHLNAPAGPDEDTDAEIGDLLPDPAPLPDELASSALDDGDREGALRQAMHTLDDRERLVVQERWLADVVAPLGALGEFLGISAGRVKQIEIGAIAKLQLNVARQRAFAAAA